jgi:hypothetical protein
MDVLALGGTRKPAGSPWWALPPALIAAPLAAFAWMSASLEMYGTTAILGSWIAVCGVAVWRRSQAWAAASVGWAAVMLLFVRVPLHELEPAMRTLVDRAEEVGPQGLPAASATSLRWAHRAAATGLRLVGMTTAADVMVQRHLPGPAIRELNSDLPMCDPVIREEAHRMWVQAEAGQTTFSPRPIRWLSWLDPSRSLPVAAAFDCDATLSGELVGDPGSGVITMHLRCPQHPPVRTVVYAKEGSRDLTWDPRVLDLLVARQELHAFGMDVRWETRRGADAAYAARGTCESAGTALFRTIAEWTLQRSRG